MAITSGQLRGKVNFAEGCDISGLQPQTPEPSFKTEQLVSSP